jgi:hypothetical protein
LVFETQAMRGKLTFANTVEQFDAGNCDGGVVEVLGADVTLSRFLGSLPLGLLPFGFPALYFLFGDSERFEHSILKAFGFGVAGDGRGGEWFHWLSIAPLVAIWIEWRGSFRFRL